MDMVYLFLTGNRSAYLNAIFTVMSMPKGIVYDLKYRDLENRSIVDNSAKSFDEKSQEKVLILFNDEHGGYVPLRFGSLKRWKKEEGQIYYSVRMGEYCNDIRNEKLCEFIDEIAPEKIRIIDIDGVGHGILAFLAEREPGRLLEKKQDSWSKVVRKLGEKALFKKYYSVFTKIQITEKGSEVEVNDKIVLKTEHNYMIRMTYYIPDFNAVPMEYIPVQFYESDKSLGIIEMMNALLSEQNVIEILCSTVKKDVGNQKNAFRYEILKERINGKIVQYARTPIEVEVKGSLSKKIYYFLTIMAIILLGVANFLNSAIIDENSSKVLTAAISGVITLVTWLMIKLIGKPKI